MKVEIWSDVVCPWCYIGKRRFEQALAGFAEREQVEVVWRAFELDPAAVSSPPGAGGADLADRLAAKYGLPRPQAEQMLAATTATAAAEGLDYHFEHAVHANTADAHQVIHLGGVRGVQDAVKERLMRAYFSEGEAVGDREVLVRLAAGAGLDADEVRAALADQRYAAAVRDDQAEARALGICGVPCFVIARTYGISGAQPAEHLLQALRQAWSESHPLVPVGAGAEGPVCGPDGC